MSYAYFVDKRNLNFARYYRALAGFVVVMLLFVTTTRLTPLQGDAAVEMTGEGSALRQIITLLSALLILWACRPFANPGRLLRFPISLVVVLIWCGLSLAWSPAPEVALRRLVLTLLVLWTTFRAVDSLGYRSFLRILCYACIALLVANYAAVALSPAGIHTTSELTDTSTLGAWRGILPHKNGTGPLCALTLFLLVFGIGNIPLLLRLGIMAADVFFLVQTNSKTSMALAIVAIAGGYLMKIYNPRLRVMMIPLIVIAGAAVALALDIFLPRYLDELDSSTDAFTGRIQIWRIMIRYIGDHPLLGAGFSSFWNAGDDSPISHYATERWILMNVAEGHNGYLDITTQLGLIGLVLAVAGILLVPMAKLIFENDIPGKYRALMFAILFFSIGHNFTETSILATDQFMQLVLMLTLACIEDILLPTRAMRRQRFFKWLNRLGQDVKYMLIAAFSRSADDPAPILPDASTKPKPQRRSKPTRGISRSRSRQGTVRRSRPSR